MSDTVASYSMRIGCAVKEVRIELVNEPEGIGYPGF